jgi:dUTP pyrophosphatase
MFKFEVKLLPGGKLPERGSLEDAGIDVYAAESKTIDPGEITKIPLGFKTQFSFRYVALIKDRSGLALRGLHVLAGVIDSGYRGEWQVVMVNLSKHPLGIQLHQKIAQILVIPISHSPLVEVDELNLTERGEKGFGSSDIIPEI